VNYMPDRCCGHPRCGAARDRNRRRRGNAPIPGNGRVLWDARCHFVRFAVHTYLLHGCSVALRETCARRLTHHRLSGRDVDARKDARRTLSFESVIYAGCQWVLHGCGIEPRCLFDGFSVRDIRSRHTTRAGFAQERSQGFWL
jgi:hypothetical protein